jgi:hypothetical protein
MKQPNSLHARSSGRSLVSRSYEFAMPGVKLKSEICRGSKSLVNLGVRTRNGDLNTVSSSLLVDWSANPLSRNAQAPSQSESE